MRQLGLHVDALGIPALQSPDGKTVPKIVKTRRVSPIIENISANTAAMPKPKKAAISEHLLPVAMAPHQAGVWV